MSGATVAYNLRQNKNVERHLFIDLLRIYSRWKSLTNHLYVGFGGVYFEDYKLLHATLGIDKMISLEQEPWMLPRQRKNVPFGCIEPRHQPSGQFITQVEEQRAAYSVDNILLWLDYAKPKDLVAQLGEVRSVIPKLVNGDVIKITLSLHTQWLDGWGPYAERHKRRLARLRSELGATYLPDGVNISSVQDEVLPELYRDTLRRAIFKGMSEISHLEFVPLGCYAYSDGTQMLTVTGAIVEKLSLEQFFEQTRLLEFDLGSPDWRVIRIRIPDLSLRERFALDENIYIPQLGMPAATREPVDVASSLGFQLTENPAESLAMIESYIQLYRYYPNFHRVQL